MDRRLCNRRLGHSISHQAGSVGIVAPVGESVYDINYSFAQSPLILLTTHGLRGSLGNVFVGAIDKSAVGCRIVVKNNTTNPVAFSVSWLAVAA